jgi:hypothetical protein
MAQKKLQVKMLTLYLYLTLPRSQSPSVRYNAASDVQVFRTVDLEFFRLFQKRFAEAARTASKPFAEAARTASKQLAEAVRTASKPFCRSS